MEIISSEPKPKALKLILENSVKISAMLGIFSAIFLSILNAVNYLGEYGKMSALSVDMSYYTGITTVNIYQVISNIPFSLIISSIGFLYYFSYLYHAKCFYFITFFVLTLSGLFSYFVIMNHAVIIIVVGLLLAVVILTLLTLVGSGVYYVLADIKLRFLQKYYIEQDNLIKRILRIGKSRQRKKHSAKENKSSIVIFDFFMLPVICCMILILGWTIYKSGYDKALDNTNYKLYLDDGRLYAILIETKEHYLISPGLITIDGSENSMNINEVADNLLILEPILNFSNKNKEALSLNVYNRTQKLIAKEGVEYTMKNFDAVLLESQYIN